MPVRNPFFFFLIWLKKRYREVLVGCLTCKDRICYQQRTGKVCARCYWQSAGCSWPPGKAPMQKRRAEGIGRWRLRWKGEGFPTLDKDKDKDAVRVPVMGYEEDEDASADAVPEAEVQLYGYRPTRKPARRAQKKRECYSQSGSAYVHLTRALSR